MIQRTGQLLHRFAPFMVVIALFWVQAPLSAAPSTLANITIIPENDQTTYPGTIVSYEYLIVNNELDSITFDLSLENANQGWSLTFDDGVDARAITLGAEGTVKVVVEHRPSANTGNDDSDRFDLVATAENGTELDATSNRTTITAEYGFEFFVVDEEVWAGAGNTLTYELYVSNTGLSRETNFSITVLDAAELQFETRIVHPIDGMLDARHDGFELSTNDSINFHIEVLIPRDAPLGRSETVTIEVVSEGLSGGVYKRQVELRTVVSGATATAERTNTPRATAAPYVYVGPTMTPTPDTQIYADMYEPNNHFGQAHALPLGGSFDEITLWPNGDIDLFSFEGEAGEAYMITTFDVDTGLVPLMVVYDSAGNVITTDERSESEYAFMPQHSGTFFVQITNNGTEDPTNLTYKLTIYDENNPPQPTPAPTSTPTLDELAQLLENARDLVSQLEEMLSNLGEDITPTTTTTPTPWPTNILQMTSTPRPLRPTNTPWPRATETTTPTPTLTSIPCTNDVVRTTLFQQSQGVTYKEDFAATVQADEQNIALTWSTGTEDSTSGFVIQRIVDGDTFALPDDLTSFINVSEPGLSPGILVQNRGNPTTGANYFVIDDDAELTEGATHLYRLIEADTNNRFIVLDVIAITIGADDVVESVTTPCAPATWTPQPTSTSTPTPSYAYPPPDTIPSETFDGNSPLGATAVQMTADNYTFTTALIIGMITLTLLMAAVYYGRKCD